MYLPRKKNFDLVIMNRIFQGSATGYLQLKYIFLEEQLIYKIYLMQIIEFYLELGESPALNNGSGDSYIYYISNSQFKTIKI